MKTILNLKVLVLLVMLVSCLPSSMINLSDLATTTTLPIETLTSNPIVTLKTEPTETANVHILGPLNPYLVGVGKHGAMVCINLENQQSIEGMKIIANISQDNIVLDRNIGLEETETHGNCFELIDAKYKVGLPVTIEIIARSDLTKIENGKQISTLGDMGIYPFLQWVFGTSELNTKSNRIGFPSAMHPNAYDLQPQNSEFIDGENHPVISPCDGIITLYEYVDLGGTRQFHNLFLFCQKTGYFLQLGHVRSVLENGRFVLGDRSIPIYAGQQLGELFKDPTVGYPHIHTALLKPLDFASINSRCLGGMINDTSCSKVIDIFIPSLTEGAGTSPKYGMWLPEFLPDGTKKFIESGEIQPNY